MLEPTENKQAQRIIALDVPRYRQAYSDRMAWVMAYMAELAYLKYDKPNADTAITLQLVERALKKTRRRTSERILGAIRQSYDYDHQEQRRELDRSLDQIGWRLHDTFSSNGN